MRMKAPVEEGKGGAALVIFEPQALLTQNLCILLRVLVLEHPPPYAHTPIKSYKDLRSYSDHKQVLSLSKHNGNVKSTVFQNEVLDDKRNTDLSWLDEKFKCSDTFAEKPKSLGHRYLEKDRIWVDQYQPEDKIFRKFDEVDDGAESDSSSDLFELQNYDLGIYSSGLPVYETTNMDSIKRGAPISNGTL